MSKCHIVGNHMLLLICFWYTQKNNLNVTVLVITFFTHLDLWLSSVFNMYLPCLPPLPPLGTLLGILACLGKGVADGTVEELDWNGAC